MLQSNNNLAANRRGGHACQLQSVLQHLFASETADNGEKPIGDTCLIVFACPSLPVIGTE